MHCIVHIPEYQTDECNNLLETLNYAYNGRKLKGTGHTYIKINVEVHQLVLGLVPQWVVCKAWEDANPNLEHKSCLSINSENNKIPNMPELCKFTHQFEPLKHLKWTYKVILEPETTNSVTVDKTDSVVKPLSTGGASSAPPQVDASLLALVATTTSGLVVVEHPAPTSASASSNSHVLPPTLPFPYVPNGPQPILVQMGNQCIWMQPVLLQSQAGIQPSAQ
ncbi:hypothetical protein RSAG8_12732, partial [Rhizoctonia solani AG-8 WAC10335]